MSGLDDDTLQRLYDGELDADEFEKAQKAVAENADDAKRLESLSQMRTLIRAEAEAAADAADFDGLWSAVAAQIQQEPQSEPSSVTRTDADPDHGLKPGALARLKVWLGVSMGGHPVRWAAAGACAVAVAVVLGVLFGSNLIPQEVPTRKSAANVESGDDVDIEKIEFKGRHPDIFQIKDGKRTTTVIWVYPEDEDDDENGTDAGDDPGSTDPI